MTTMKAFFKLLILALLFQSLAYAQSDKLDLITQNNKLRVCIWTEYYGISYLDPRTQRLVGIDSDLAVELAKDLGVTLEYVQSSFVTLIEDLSSDKCDIAMFAIGDTDVRREKIRFTSPHLASDIYAITTKTNKKINSWDDIDRDDIVVSVAKGTYHEPVMKNRLKHAELFVATNFHERGQAVISGRADLFMTDFPFAKRMMEQTDWAKLITPDRAYHITFYAWAMAYGNDKFYNRVEKFIEDIKKDGRLLRLAKNNGLSLIVKLD